MILDEKFGVKILLKHPDDFLKVKETLERMGIPSRREKKLTQSCHILHKKGNFWIVHFKEMFSLDGKQSNFSKEDEARRNVIANLLEEWGLVELVSPEEIRQNLAPISSIKIIPHRERAEWILEAKYNMGKAKRPVES